MNSLPIIVLSSCLMTSIASFSILYAKYRYTRRIAEAALASYEYQVQARRKELDSSRRTFQRLTENMPIEDVITELESMVNDSAFYDIVNPQD